MCQLVFENQHGCIINVTKSHVDGQKLWVPSANVANLFKSKLVADAGDITFPHLHFDGSILSPFIS